MSRILVAALVAALASWSPLTLAGDAKKAQYEKQCRQYAKEDAVPKEELAEYVAQCIDDLAAADEDASSDQAPPARD